MVKTTFLTGLLSAALAACVSAAPLEPADGKMLFGAWYDRIQGDSPVAITQRLGKHMSVWQSDINITSTLQRPDQFFQQVIETKTDAIIYLTVYPIEGFDVVTDAAIDEMCDMVGNVTKTGRGVFLRYASEMNGSWFVYGQQPRKFLAQYRKVADKCREKSDRSKLAIIWAPNSGDNYPWPRSTPWPGSATADSPDFDLLDTNKDGNFTVADDAYAPYYPGDDYVDWIGLSVYHYGPQYPWVNNTMPLDGRVEMAFVGRSLLGDSFTPLYELYSHQKGIPCMLSETGATYHMEVFQGEFSNPGVPQTPGPGRVAIKQHWWRQIFNETFQREFPKLKAVGFFEFMKYEEDTLRDFTNLGAHPGTRSPFNAEPEQNAVLAAFKEDLPNFEKMIIWANETVLAPTPSGSPTPGTKPSENWAVGVNGGMMGVAVAGVVAILGYLAVF